MRVSMGGYQVNKKISVHRNSTKCCVQLLFAHVFASIPVKLYGLLTYVLWGREGLSYIVLFFWRRPLLRTSSVPALMPLPDRRLLTLASSVTSRGASCGLFPTWLGLARAESTLRDLGRNSLHDSEVGMILVSALTLCTEEMYVIPSDIPLRPSLSVLYPVCYIPIQSHLRHDPVDQPAAQDECGRAEDQRPHLVGPDHVEHKLENIGLLGAWQNHIDPRGEAGQRYYLSRAALG